MGKCIKRLFPQVRATFCKHNGLRTTKYQGLAYSSADDHQPLSVPQYCTFEECDGLVKLTVPTTKLLSNESVLAQFIVNTESGALTLRLSNLEYEVNLVDLAITPTISELHQRHINGMVRIVTSASLCTGQPWEQDLEACKQLKSEDWSTLGKGSESAQRVRSLKCKGILHFIVSSTAEVCSSCQILQNRRVSLKRKALKEIHQNEQTPDCRVNEEPAEKKIVCEADINTTPELEEETVLLHEDDHDDMVKIIRKLEEEIPNNFATLVKSQVRNATRSNKDPRHRRWDPAVISICLALWCRSPHAYKQLKSSNMLVLPSGRLLQYYKNSIKQTPGFHRENLKWMWTEAKNQSIPESGWNGGILIDEMQIQDDIQVE